MGDQLAGADCADLLTTALDIALYIHAGIYQEQVDVSGAGIGDLLTNALGMALDIHTGIYHIK